MKEMMQNPSLQKLLDNPAQLDAAVQMMKSPLGRQQLEGVAKQTGMSVDTIVKVMSCMASLAKVYKKVSPVLPVIKYGLAILIGSYVLKWLGFI